MLGFLRKESSTALNGLEPQKDLTGGVRGGGTTELNLLMRLTDDYLLITTEKNNAMLFIEKLCQLSQGNYFKFNMKKLKTNFPINYQKLNSLNKGTTEVQQPGTIVVPKPGLSDQFPPPLDETELFSWIGISIDQQTLNIVQNINTKKEGILCTLNINMSTKESVLWLKRKLKSFLMNNVTHYFNQVINSKEYAQMTLKKLYIAAAEKYLTCCVDFRSFHTDTTLSPIVDIKIVQVLYVVIRSFFKYLVCNVRSPIYSRGDYLWFFQYSLHFFTTRFGMSKGQGFKGVFKMLKAKEEKLKKEKFLDFQIK